MMHGSDVAEGKPAVTVLACEKQNQVASSRVSKKPLTWVDLFDY